VGLGWDRVNAELQQNCPNKNTVPCPLLFLENWPVFCSKFIQINKIMKALPYIRSLITITSLTAACTLGAQTITNTASSNGTIQSGGPSTSPWFHTAQVPGDFASYAISSFLFTATDFGLPEVTGVTLVEISYTQSNAFFTSSGPVAFYVSFDTIVGDGDYSGLTNTGSGNGINNSQFTDSPSSQFVGDGTFTEVSSGTIDTYTLTFGGALATSLVNAINNGDRFSILLTTPEGPGNNTAATYAGIQNNTYPDQIDMSITAVPEPQYYASLLGLLAIGFAIYRRRRS